MLRPTALAPASPPAPPRAGPARRGLLALGLVVALAHVAAVHLASLEAPQTTAPPTGADPTTTIAIATTTPPLPSRGVVDTVPPTPLPPAAAPQALPASPDLGHTQRNPSPTGHPPPRVRARPAPAPQPEAALPSVEPENSKQNKPPALSEKVQAAITSIANNTPESAASLAPATPSTAALPASSGSEPGPDTEGSPHATVPHHVAVPSSVELRYDVSASRKGATFSADSTLRLNVTDHRYDAQLTLQAWLVGARVQTSRGELDPAWGLVPQRFGDKNRNKSEQAAHFDRSRQPAVVRFSANTPDAPLPPGAQDRLSVLLQLAAMLAGEPQRYRPGQHIHIYTAGPRDAEWWDFEVRGTEALDLPAGRLNALHLLRTPTQPYDNRVELWMAPELGHLPVRVLWTQANGDVVDQRLSGHSP